MSNPILFLCSGGGGNLRFVSEAMSHGWISKWDQIAVIADRECAAIEFAKKNELRNYVVNLSDDQSELLQLTSKIKPGVVLSTIHKVLKPNYLENFGSIVQNLHYSLLPSFAGTIGTQPVIDALRYGNLIIGATVHRVNEFIDSGRPCVQVALPVYKNDNVNNLMDLQFRAGCFALLTALTQVEDEDGAAQFTNPVSFVDIGDRTAMINPSTSYPIELSDSDFWETLRK